MKNWRAMVTRSVTQSRGEGCELVPLVMSASGSPGRRGGNREGELHRFQRMDAEACALLRACKTSGRLFEP